MDYTVVPSSLLLHRMYAELADKGYMIDDPASITTYADFLEILSSSSSSAQINANEAKNKYVNEIINNSDSLIKADNILSVGIDLEEISSFKSVNNLAIVIETPKAFKTPIKKGDIVGTIGTSGRSTGPHLDIRLNWFGVKLDPASVLNLN